MNLSKRNNFIANNIIFLDGISGSGKTMLSPILSSFNRVEVGIFDSRIENINILDKLDLIQNDVAEHIINIYADITSYETHIGRGTNFRLHDLSGVFNNPKSIKNIKRALSKYNSENILKEICREKKIKYKYIYNRNLLVLRYRQMITIIAKNILKDTLSFFAWIINIYHLKKCYRNSKSKQIVFVGGARGFKKIIKTFDDRKIPTIHYRNKYL